MSYRTFSHKSNVDVQVLMFAVVCYRCDLNKWGLLYGRSSLALEKKVWKDKSLFYPWTATSPNSEWRTYFSLFCKRQYCLPILIGNFWNCLRSWTPLFCMNVSIAEFELRQGKLVARSPLLCMDGKCPIPPNFFRYLSFCCSQIM